MNNNPTFKRILRFAVPEWRLLSWGMVFLIIASALMLVYPQTIKVMIDEALTTKNVDQVNRMGFWLMIVLVFQGVAGAARYYCFTLAGERIVRGIRNKLFARILDQEIGFFDGNPTGDLLSRINADSGLLQNALSVNLSMLLRNIGAAIGGIVLMFFTSAKLTLALLLVIPFGLLVALRFGKNLKNLSAKTQEATGGATQVAEEAISSVRTIRSFVGESQERDRFDRTTLTALSFARERIAAITRFIGIASTLGLGALVAVLWYGGQMVISDELSMGTLSSYILYAMTVAFSVGTLGGLWTDFMSALGASGRIFSILDRTPLVPARGGETLKTVSGRIQLSEVQFSYPTRDDVVVLKNINIALEPGQITALVGASGSGKSSIASLMQRFYDPTAGDLLLDATEYRRLDPNWLRTQIGTVSQEPVLLSTSIRENIAYARPSASLAEIERVAAATFVDEFAKRFPSGYDTQVGERGIQLSGGQKQRVAIARAMLKDPKILILDEATSALDAESEAFVQKALEALMIGRTVLIIAHRLSTIKNADRIVVMQSGSIVQQGRHEQLIADHQGAYYKLVNKQMGTASL